MGARWRTPWASAAAAAPAAQPSQPRQSRPIGRWSGASPSSQSPPNRDREPAGARLRWTSIINVPAGQVLLRPDKPSKLRLCCGEMTGDMERALGALRDFTRRDILLRFYADRKPRSVDDVARDAGIHRSVAFDHLERLVGLGYLEVERRRAFPGKPAKIYRLTAAPVQISHPMRRYDILADALVRSFQDLGDDGGASKIKDAGRSLGRKLASSTARSVQAALEPLIEMGGEYEAGRDGRVACTNCLFAEVCFRVRDICLFHAGLIEGLIGRDVEPSHVESICTKGPSC